MLKHGPQILPKSNFLLLFATILSLLMSTLVNNFSAALTELLLLSAITSGLVLFFGHKTRLVQTLTAVMGTGFVVGLAVAATLVISPSPNLVVRLLIFFWNLAILTNILKHSLDIHRFQAALLSVVYAFFVNKLVIVVQNNITQSFP